MKYTLLIIMSTAVLVWCGDASTDKTSGNADVQPYVVLKSSDIPQGGKTSQSSLTFNVIAKNDKSTHYAYKFLHGRVDCSSVSFNAYTPISNPIKLNDTGNTGEKTICLSGRGLDANKDYVFQQHPTQVTFLKVDDAEATDTVKVISRGMPQASCQDSFTAKIDLDTGSKAKSFKWCLIKNRTQDTCLSCTYSKALNLAEHGSIKLTNIGNTGEKELCLKGTNGTNEQFPATSYIWQKTETGTATIDTIINQYDPSNDQTIKVSGSCAITHYKYYFYEHHEHHVPCPAVQLFGGMRSIKDDLVLLDLVNNEGLYKTLCIAGTNSRGQPIQSVPNRIAWVARKSPANIPTDIPATLKILNGTRTVFSSGDKDTRYILLKNVSSETVNWTMNIIGKNKSEYFATSLGKSKWTTIENNSNSVKKIIHGTLEADKIQKIYFKLHRSYKTDYTNYENYVSVFFRDEDNPNKHISQLLHVRAPVLKFNKTFTKTRSGERRIILTSKSRHVRIQVENSAFPCLNYEGGILVQKVKCGKLDWIVMPAPGKKYERWFYYMRGVEPTLPRRGLLKHNYLQVGIDKHFIPKKSISTKIRIVSNELDDTKGSDIYNYNHPILTFKKQNDDGSYRDFTVKVPWRTGKVHDITIIFNP